MERNRKGKPTGVRAKKTFKHDRFHSFNGEPAISCVLAFDKGKPLELFAWYKNGKLHRHDGPAVIAPNYTAWVVRGEDRKTESKIEMKDVSQITPAQLKKAMRNTCFQDVTISLPKLPDESDDSS